MTWKEILGLTVLGAIVTTSGSLLALYIKEFVATRWLERWKARQTLLGVYRRYQLPIFLAAEELSGRLYGLSRDSNDREERDIGLDILRNPARREQHAGVSEHYLGYRFVSNIYRLCSFLGWVELYRRDIGNSMSMHSTAIVRWTPACVTSNACWPMVGSISMAIGGIGVTA